MHSVNTLSSNSTTSVDMNNQLVTSISTNPEPENINTIQQPNHPRRTKPPIARSIRRLICEKYEAGLRYTDISKDTNVPRGTVFAICQIFSETGEWEAKPRGGTRNKKITDRMLAFLNDELQEDCTLTLQVLRERINTKFNTYIKSNSTIHNALKGINYTMKMITPSPLQRNTPERINQRYEYAQEYDQINCEFAPKNIIFIDEVGFSLSIRVNKGRSLSGSQALLKVPYLRSRNLSSCAAMNCTGVLINCTKPGAHDGISFLRFLGDLFRFLAEENYGRCCIIMDNVRFHKMNEIRDFIDSYGHKQVFLPAYSPSLNPIEECSSKWKNYVKRSRCNNEEDLLRKIDTGMEHITAADAQAWILHMNTFLVKSRNREEIL